MAGLHFYKKTSIFHTHTPASNCYLNKEHSAEMIANAALAKGLSGIAVTDHNTAGWIDEIKKATEGTDLVIFPGVELSLEQGHLVALFDPSATQKECWRITGGSRHQTCLILLNLKQFVLKMFMKLLKKFMKRGGLAVLAHIDQLKGIFHDLVKKE